MRLIDADAFRDYTINGWEEAKNNFRTEHYQEVAAAVTESLLLDIDEQKTAYDVDKVIKQLEKEQIASYITVQRAIEIVKRGGIGIIEE